MFQLFHIAGLLQFAYRDAADPHTDWRITRFALSPTGGGRQGRWEVHLASPQTATALPWTAFLHRFHLADEPSLPVGRFIERTLADVETSLQKDFPPARRSWFRRAAPVPAPASLWQPDGTYRQWIAPGVTLGDGAGGNRLTPLLDALAHDRSLLEQGLDPEAAAPDHQPLTLPDAADAIPDPLAPTWLSQYTGFQRRLDQTIGNSRNLLTLSDRTNPPSAIAAIAGSSLAGALNAAILNLLQQTLPDFDFTVGVAIDRPATTLGAAPVSYTADWQADLPLWSRELATPIRIHVAVGVEGLDKGSRHTVAETLQAARAMAHRWTVARQEPLAGGGDGWVCLLPQGPWNEELFALWLGRVTTATRIRRYHDLGPDPEPAGDPHHTQRVAGRAQLRRAILADLRGAHDLDRETWEQLATHHAHWPADEFAQLRDAFSAHLQALLANPDTSADALRAWLISWEAFDRPDSEVVLRAALDRCRAEDDPAFGELALSLWNTLDHPDAYRAACAASCRRGGHIGDDARAAVMQGLNDTDPRRIASDALRALHEAPDDLAWIPLAQQSPDMSLTDADRDRIAAALDRRTDALDHGQDPACWKALLTHRDHLVRCGLLDG